MNISRIEVPLTLPPPHFDDEATIATARQVVPIKSGHRINGRRKILPMATLLLASTLCGALGAIAVNYFERRSATDTPATQQQPLAGVSRDANVELAPVVTAPEVSAKTEPSPAPKDYELVSAREAVKAESENQDRADERRPEKSSTASAKREPGVDAGKLIRKRRVQPTDPEIPQQRSRRSGAGRIEDLFSGPNP